MLVVMIAVLAAAGVVLRPWRLPEAVWAVLGASALVALGLLDVRSAMRAVARGGDVYAFLVGMMLLSELARREGLFDAAAGFAVRHAAGSGARLFAWVYGIGTLVTVFMSNDATAVVLTPAVYAVCRQAGAKPLPYLIACAMVANAASFMLPISNPANLVVFGSHLPPLADWFSRFALACTASTIATFAVLRWRYRRELAVPLGARADARGLSATARVAAAGIAVAAGVLLVASARDVPLGLPTLLTALLAAAVVQWRKREAPWALLGGISWLILPLVAGLFVLVEGLSHAGVLAVLTTEVRAMGEGAAVFFAVACNLVNNLPAGLIAGTAMANADRLTQGAVAIGIDIGPNLSVTGSLATILWLSAIRREGENVTAWQFLRVGIWAMPAGLAAALLVLRLMP